MKQLKIAIVGSTGMVGRTFLKVIEEYGLGEHEYTLMASEKSKGRSLPFLGKEYPVEVLSETSFDSGYDIALFSAGGSTSEKYAPIAAAKGAVVIDNSSQWRMAADVPLVVPEVNPQDIEWNKGIIANPNCSTIQAVVALNPLHKKYGIKRIVYATYQAVSGAGIKGVDDLKYGIENYFYEETEHPMVKFPHPIFNNALPHIDVFLDSGYTKEEQKMVDETHKILGDNDIKITATCVRVPVFNSHSEAINIELANPYELADVFALLKNAPGVTVVDDPVNNAYPLAADATGTDDVYVGRIRRDDSVENGLHLWVVSDNIRKGAASNAVQIAKLLIDKMNN